MVLFFIALFLDLTPRRSTFSTQPRCYSSIPICGYDVKLPPNLELYRTQKTMIAKVLTSLKNRLSALIESPTGSGKTLALLSSTCAWLAKYKEERVQSKLDCLACNKRSSPSTSTIDESSEVCESLTESEVITPMKPLQKLLTVEEEYEMDFTPKGPIFTTNGEKWFETSKRIKLEDGGISEIHEKHTCLPKVTIYYGTRTHKQIGQVVKEFSRLPYGHNGVLKHTILGSREHTCINRLVRDSGGDMKGKCIELIGPKGVGCSFKNAMRPKYERPSAVRDLLSANLERMDDVWDIEDLVKALSISTPSICPYFTSTRVLTEDADLVFCPFNYMLDPIIRDNSDVSLKNSIVVLDEAHNVEDVCRDSSSFSFTENEIVCACMEFRHKGAEVDRIYEKTQKKLVSSDGIADDYMIDQKKNDAESYHQLSEAFKMINKFMNDVLSWFTVMTKEALRMSLEKNNRSAFTFSWERLYTSLSEATFLRFEERGSGGAFGLLINALSEVCGGSEYADKFKPNSLAIVCAEKFTYFLNIYFKEDHRTCYKLFVCVEKPYEMRSRFGNQEKPNDVLDMSIFENKGGNFWLDSGSPLSDYKAVKPGYRVNLELWCMRPALAYLDAFKSARSVILASGTLSPMETFKSELGVEFQQQMEGSQVIPEEQIFAAVIPAGPNNHRLRATYRNINADDRFVNELALVLRSVCERIPKGILCFVASYRLLEQLYEFMETSGILRQIMTVKHILREPRRSAYMNDIMAEYEEAIDCPERFGPHCTGALMFAVFRGKVSEGIDFTDDRARCVVSVGIPFPNAVDEQVIEKKRYNDDNCKKMNLLSGEDWYIMQAYRALNQALGRCLRHRNDWGVILMVDDRLLPIRSNANSNKVSRWIREQLRPLNGYNDFLSKLTTFVNERQTKDTAEESIVDAATQPNLL